MSRLSEAEAAVETLKQERDNWRDIALHLADLHAGTAEYDGMLSKTSLSSKKRFMGICRVAKESIAAGKLQADSSFKPSIASICHRLGAIQQELQYVLRRHL